jgi:hypothetical protein
MTDPVPAATDDQSHSSQNTPSTEAADMVAGDGTDTAVAAEPAGSSLEIAVERANEDPVGEESAAVAAMPPVAAPVKPLPDRADAPVSEVVERFLKAVVAQVPVELIEELHLFSPLRQGTLETGIAVLAARVPVAVPGECNAEPELPFAAETAAPAGATDAREADVDSADAHVADAHVADAHMDDAHVADAHVDHADVADVGETAVQAAPVDVAAHNEQASALSVVAAEGDDDEVVSVADDERLDVMIGASADESDEADAVAEAAPVKAARPVRHTVYTARYRYVIKGPERGKWESTVTAEADAPLITVETVVRGVQRRAGEESEIVRYNGAQIARALRVPYNA